MSIGRNIDRVPHFTTLPEVLQVSEDVLRAAFREREVVSGSNRENFSDQVLWSEKNSVEVLSELLHLFICQLTLHYSLSHVIPFVILCKEPPIFFALEPKHSPWVGNKYRRLKRLGIACLEHLL